MPGARPEQAILTKNNDLSKTEETRRVVESMVDGLNDHVVDGIGAFFHPDFRWIGSAGCGVRHGLKAFQDGWQRSFLNAFSDKVCVDEARIAEGEWMGAFGRQEATHTGEFMGIPATGKRVNVRYMDFWKVQDGKIIDNWVMIDVIDVMRQLGVDPLNGKGWDDRGEGFRPPSQIERPDAA